MWKNSAAASGSTDANPSAPGMSHQLIDVVERRGFDGRQRDIAVEAEEDLVVGCGGVDPLQQDRLVGRFLCLHQQHALPDRVRRATGNHHAVTWPHL